MKNFMCRVNRVRGTVLLGTLLTGMCAGGAAEPEAVRIVREAEAAVLGASTVYLETTTSSTSPRFFGGRGADPITHRRDWYAGPKFRTQILGHPDGANNEITCDGQRTLNYFPHLEGYWILPATKPDLPRTYQSIVGIAASDLTAHPDAVDLKRVATEDLDGSPTQHLRLEVHYTSTPLRQESVQHLWFSDTNPPLLLRVGSESTMHAPDGAVESTMTAAFGLPNPGKPFHFSSETRVTCRLNEALPEDLFVTVPPPGAKEMEIPESVKAFYQQKSE